MVWKNILWLFFCHIAQSCSKGWLYHFCVHKLSCCLMSLKQEQMFKFKWALRGFCIPQYSLHTCDWLFSNPWAEQKMLSLKHQRCGQRFKVWNQASLHRNSQRRRWMKELLADTAERLRLLHSPDTLSSSLLAVCLNQRRKPWKNLTRQTLNLL